MKNWAARMDGRGSSKRRDAADWALVMEPARENGGLVTRRGMVGAVSFEIHGAATHATNRHLGASAIVEAAHKILALEALTDMERGVLVNVGIIEAGNARQVDSGSCRSQHRSARAGRGRGGCIDRARPGNCRADGGSRGPAR